MVKKIVKDITGKKLKEIQRDLSKKVMMFDKIGDECLACEEPFDKSDIEMVRSWHVIVRKEEDIVNLYCPECFAAATKVVKDFAEKVEKERK